jgi:hypothetical protein
MARRPIFKEAKIQWSTRTTDEAYEGLKDIARLEGIPLAVFLENLGRGKYIVTPSLDDNK